MCVTESSIDDRSRRAINVMRPSAVIRRASSSN